MEIFLLKSFLILSISILYLSKNIQSSKIVQNYNNYNPSPNPYWDYSNLSRESSVIDPAVPSTSSFDTSIANGNGYSNSESAPSPSYGDPSSGGYSSSSLTRGYGNGNSQSNSNSGSGSGSETFRYQFFPTSGGGGGGGISSSSSYGAPSSGYNGQTDYHDEEVEEEGSDDLLDPKTIKKIVKILKLKKWKKIGIFKAFNLGIILAPILLPVLLPIIGPLILPLILLPLGLGIILILGFLFFPVPVVVIPNCGSGNTASGIFRRSFSDSSKYLPSSSSISTLNLTQEVLQSSECIEKISCELSSYTRGSMFEGFITRALKKVSFNGIWMKRFSNAFNRSSFDSSCKMFKCNPLKTANDIIEKRMNN